MLNIKVVGTGCPSCNKLESLCKEVTIEQKLEAEIENLLIEVIQEYKKSKK